jgi:hypothetical protein
MPRRLARWFIIIQNLPIFSNLVKVPFLMIGIFFGFLSFPLQSVNVPSGMIPCPYLSIRNVVSPWAPTISSVRGWTVKSMPSIGNAPKRTSSAPGTTSAGQTVFLFFT